MATPTFSGLLTPVALQQLSELSALYGKNKTQVVIRAIETLYQKETGRMKPTNLMTVDERRLHEAVTGIKLPPQTVEEEREALRLAAAEAWNYKEERPMSSLSHARLVTLGTGEESPE